ERPLVLALTGHLTITQGGHLADQTVTLARPVTLGDVVAQDDAGGLGDREVTRGLRRRFQTTRDRAEQIVVGREDHRLLRPVVPEEGRASDTGTRGDVVDGRVV